MSLKETRVIELPDSKGSSFDHGAFDLETRRIFVAHVNAESLSAARSHWVSQCAICQSRARSFPRL